MKQFWGTDFGVIALAKNAKENNISIEISHKKTAKNATTESDFWSTSIKNIIENTTKFGRIGILFDRKNKEAISFCKEIAIKEYAYTQKNSRAETEPRMHIIETQLLCEMANEGLSDSVEFRRHLRKYIRNAKHLHIDSLLFMESIFDEEKTRKIIENIAGSQIDIHTITTKSVDEKKQNPAKKTFTICTDDDAIFTKKRAEQILQKKLKSTDIIKKSAS